jgi:hypothetical protein
MISQVTAQAQYIAVFVATSQGLGKSYVDLSTSGIEDIGKVGPPYLQARLLC